MGGEGSDHKEEESCTMCASHVLLVAGKQLKKGGAIEVMLCPERAT